MHDFRRHSPDNGVGRAGSSLGFGIAASRRVPQWLLFIALCGLACACNSDPQRQGSYPARSATFKPTARTATGKSATRVLAADAIAVPPAGARTLGKLRLQAARGEWAAAMQRAAQLESRYPDIQDHVALLAGDVQLSRAPKDACRAYARAQDSVASAVRVKAQVGQVRCVIAQASVQQAAKDLRLLQRRYPALPQRAVLDLELAQAHATKKRWRSAVAAYQRIDLHSPWTASAKEARARLSALQAKGVRVRPYSRTQRLQRAQALVANGSVTEAWEEVRALEGQRWLRGEDRKTVYRMALRLAKRQADVPQQRRYESKLKGHRKAQAQSTSQAAAQRARTRAAQQAIQRVRRGRPLTRLKEVQLVHVVRLAAPAGLTREVNVALHMLQRRRRLHPRLALRAAIAAAGVGEDARIVALLTRARTRYPRKVPSALRYHRARALERSGKLSKACAAYDDLSHDSHAGDYYRIWAKARLQSLTTSSSASECKPPRPFEAVAASGLNQVPSLADIEALTTPLRALAKRHAKAYPWLKRAADLIDLGEFALAADEMHEAYLAWRAARGRTLRGAGLEAVYRGTARTRRYVPWKLKRARRALSEADVRLLAKAARRLGDMGTAVGFAGQAWLRQRPRAYRAQVHQAAQAHGLDPNLLFAVMRVESIYHRRIVSYAGAVGLMQIMPGTGRRIAQQLEMRDFNTAALLEPHTNLRFAAWYLASLLERFDGRLPLAIASYNGGPHNVRQWMQNQSPDMPLDAFLERIPFTQTHRYVRRVLTHYAAYRAQEGLAVPELHLKLPAIKPDDVAF